MLSYVVNISDCKCLHVGVTSPFGFKLSASDTPIDGKSPYTLRPYLGRRHGQGRARNLKGGQKGKAKGRPGMAGHRRAANELRCLPHCARELEYEFACELWNCSTICVSLWSIDIMSWKVLEQIGHQTSSNITMPHQCHHCQGMGMPMGKGRGRGARVLKGWTGSTGRDGTNRPQYGACFETAAKARKKVREIVKGCQRDTPLLTAMTYSEQINNDKHVFQSRTFLFDTFRRQKHFSQQGCLPRV